MTETLPFGLRQKQREQADSITEDIDEFVELEARVASHPVFGSITNVSRNFTEKDDGKQKNRNQRLKVSQGTNLAIQGNLPDDKTEHVVGAENAVPVNPNFKCPYVTLTVASCLKASLTKKDTSLCMKRVYVTIVFNQVTWLVLAQNRVFVKFSTAS